MVVYLMMEGLILSCDISISVKSVLYFLFFVVKETDGGQHFSSY